MENGGESFADEGEMWGPLRCLAEAACSLEARSSPQSSAVEEQQINGPENKVDIPKTDFRDHMSKSKVVQDDSNEINPIPSVSAKAKRFIGQKKKKVGFSSQAPPTAAVGECRRRIGPIWFSLVAAADQEGSTPLPQLSASYLRLKDGNLPISFVQKYLVKKLDLVNESEVEITCRGLPVSATMPMLSLIEVWLQTGPSHRTQAFVGSSAKDFVMVLEYRRSRPAN